MLASKEKLKSEGTVPNLTLCGLSDPDYNKLTFGAPEFVLTRKVENPCDQCINKWRHEEESDSDYKRGYNKFRKLIHKAIRPPRS